MEAEYIYQRPRREFGRHPYFNDKDATEFIFTTGAGNPQEGEAYIHKAPLHFEGNAVPSYSSHDVRSALPRPLASLWAPSPRRDVPWSSLFSWLRSTPLD